MTTNEPKRKGRPPKKVLHPIFAQLAEFTLDDYWKQALLSCSLGKFPRYVSYVDDLLTHRKGRIIITSLLLDSTMDQPINYTEVTTFFRGLGMASVIDNEINQQRVIDKQTAIEEPVYKNWKDIKKQQVKDNLLQSFMTNLYETLKLSNKEYRLLQASITIALLFKYLNCQTVIIENGIISKLVGLEIKEDEQGKRTFSFPYLTDEVSSDNLTPLIRETIDVVDQSKYIAVLWEKYANEVIRKNKWYDAL